MKKHKIGLFGLGTVGSSIYDYYVNRNQNKNISLTKIIASNEDKKRIIQRFNGDKLEIKKDELESMIKYSNNENNNDDYILEDPEIEIIIDATNAKDDHIIKKALSNGKSVVSANKKIIANFGNNLFKIADKNNQALRIGACVCGEVPVLKELYEYQGSASDIKSIEGIINGTSNYILTLQKEAALRGQNLSYEDIVDKARKAGYAESDVTDDVKGYDARNKLAILASIGFNVPLCDQKIVDNINCISIENLPNSIFHLGEYFGGGNSVKLVASAKKEAGQLEMSVWPTLVKNDSLLGSTDYENNIVIVDKEYGGPLSNGGKGAGGEPTASAMIIEANEIINEKENGIKHDNYGSFYDKSLPNIKDIKDMEINPIIESSSPEHEPGVFARKAYAAQRLGLDIQQIYNDPTHPDSNKPDFMVFEEMRYEDLQEQINQLSQLDCVSGPIRIYNRAHNEQFILNSQLKGEEDNYEGNDI